MHTHSRIYSDVLARFLASVAGVQPGGSGPCVNSRRLVLELFIDGDYRKHTKSKEKRMTEIEGSVAAFIKAACVPLDRSHSTGTRDEARAILTSRPEVAGRTIYKALHNAVLSDNVLEIIEELLVHGADPSICGDSEHGYRRPSITKRQVALIANTDPKRGGDVDFVPCRFHIDGHHCGALVTGEQQDLILAAIGKGTAEDVLKLIALNFLIGRLLCRCGTGHRYPDRGSERPPHRGNARQ